MVPLIPVDAQAATPTDQTTITADIPPYQKVDLVPKSDVNGHGGADFISLINDAYDKVIKWRKNLFKLPTGNAAKAFISELTKWLEHFNKNTELQGIALKVFHTLPSLLLQKPSKNSKSKEHLKKLEERLATWHAGNITQLLSEASRIQDRLTTGKQRSPDDTAKIFARLMLEGKVNAALKFLSTENSAGVLKLTNDVIEELQKKHPEPAPIEDGALLHGPVHQTPSNYFDEIDEQTILKASKLTKGAGGPSHMDAEQYRHILISSKYKKEGKDMREQIAALARKLASSYIDPDTIESLACCRLIPLEKNPGIRPIGIGEVLRRIMGKAVGWVLKEDLMQAAGPLQAAGGLQGGAEAAIHAMRTIFEADETEAVILVDASNAFNALNRQAALHNVQRTCPAFAPILINYYRQSSRLAVAGGIEMVSAEGSTQGDNLGGHFYNQGTIPLQDLLHSSSPGVKQVWLADDATGAGTLTNLKKWWDTIVSEGTKVGYYVNEPKSWLILKDANALEQATEIFEGTGIQITTEGKRHLGAAIGSSDFRVSYATKKIAGWCAEMEKLSAIAKSQPQAAFAAYIHGEQHKFSYFLRTIPFMGNLLEPLDNIIDKQFIPALFGSDAISDIERNLYSLPIRLGGLGIPVLTDKAEEDFASSKTITAPLAAIMMMQDNHLPESEEVTNLRKGIQQQKSTLLERKANLINELLPKTTQRAVVQAKEHGASNWLSILPLKEQGFNLNKGEFRDALAIRYNRNIKGLPSNCPCGQKYTLDHALNCKLGGFVTIRHNTIRDFEANLLRQTCKDVEVEPALQPLEGEQLRGLAGDGARPDIRARGFWRTGQNAFFDVRVTNVNAKSQSHLSSTRIYSKHEADKKREYNERVMQVEHGSFTPLIFSLNGGSGPECERYHRHIAQRIADKTGEKYEHIMTWIRCKLSFLIIRACLLCVRGSRPHQTRCETDAVSDYMLACDTARLHFN